MNFTHAYADNHGLRMYYEVYGRTAPGSAAAAPHPGGGFDEQAASGRDLRTMHATVPFLLRFLEEQQTLQRLQHKRTTAGGPAVVRSPTNI